MLEKRLARRCTLLFSVLKSVFCRDKNNAGLKPGTQLVDEVRFVHAGCGVNALSGLQDRAKSIYCMSHVGLISVAHQAVLHLPALLIPGLNPAL